MIPCTLYIHFPYCISRCNYCDFNTYVSPEIPQVDYTNAILREGKERATDWADRTLTSIFLGGGTPSLWEAEHISTVLNAVEDWFPNRSDNIEITMECNPMEAQAPILTRILEAGINRLSLGIQSFEDKYLQQISRRHSGSEAMDAIVRATSAGFQSVSGDLMFGLPGQTISDFQKDLDRMVSTNLQHISVYHLTLEPGTALTHAVKTKKIKLPHEDVQTEMWDRIEPTMTRAGFEQYEVSSFARSGHHSRHNTSYWQGHAYLGLGAGAHSLKLPHDWKAPDACAIRTMNQRNPKTYISASDDKDHVIDTREELDRDTHLRERIFTGLRHLPGISLEAIHNELGLDPRKIFDKALHVLENKGLIDFDGDQLKLTPDGLRYANDVFLAFF